MFVQLTGCLCPFGRGLGNAMQRAVGDSPCRINISSFIYSLSIRHLAIVLPQAGGFSAHGQPIDQVHHMLRARMDLTDSTDVGCNADIRSRPRFSVFCIIYIYIIVSAFFQRVCGSMDFIDFRQMTWIL